MKKPAKLFIVSFILLCLFTTPASANAGTPLMWAGFIHLTLGNLFIGIGEGLLLGFLFRLPKFKSIGIMIFANYFSAWLGYMILKSVGTYLVHSITIYEIQSFIWTAYIIAFVFTIIAEAPLIYAVMRKKQHPVIRTLIASAVIQTISYTGILFWYTSASYDSLFQNARIVRTFEFEHPKSLMYYLGEDKNVYQMYVDGSEKQILFEAPQKQELMKLYLQPSKTGARLCLCDVTDFYTEREENRIVIKENVLPPDQLDVLNIEEHQMVETEAIDYRPLQEQQWKVCTGFWAAQGLKIFNDQTDEYYHIALETPFAQWYVRSATVLPGDEVIFQFGPQICIYSLRTKNISLLAKGTSPVFILDRSIPAEDTEIQQKGGRHENER